MAIDHNTWYQALCDFEEWWCHCTEYANGEGIDLPRNFYQLNERVISYCRSEAGMDSSPLFEIGSLVKRHAGMVASDPDFPRDPDIYATIGDLHNAIWRSLPMKREYHEKLSHNCQKPVKLYDPTPDTLAVIRDIESGITDNSTLAQKHGISVDNAKGIKSRLQRGEYRLNS